jgi:adenylylsulfate kinase-like enzyme
VAVIGRVIFMCGPAGSGKSTIARRYEQQGRAKRDEYRELLRPLGVVPETVYLATDRAVVLRRIGDRAEPFPERPVISDISRYQSQRGER